MTVGDFNADGKADLAVANYGSDNVGVLLNAGQYRPGVRELDSPHAVRFGVQTRGFGAGQLVEGTGNAFDGAGRLEVAGQTYAPTLAADFLADGDRTVVTPTVAIAGLYVSREITVPDTGNEDFARTVDVFTNPTDSPITTTVRIVGNLGSDAATTVLDDLRRRHDDRDHRPVDRHRRRRRHGHAGDHPLHPRPGRLAADVGRSRDRATTSSGPTT